MSCSFALASVLLCGHVGDAFGLVLPGSAVRATAPIATRGAAAVISALPSHGPLARVDLQHTGAAFGLRALFLNGE